MSEQHTERLLMSEFVTHDVKRFVVSKPRGFDFEPGQGVELFVNQPLWREEGRPFTPTCRGTDRVLEFTVKRYTEHEGVTRELHALSPGAELMISEPFGTITYRGPGAFIAAGAGVTPFLAILREQASGTDLAASSLMFSNKTPADVICEKELRHYFDTRCFLTCTQARAQGYGHGRIDRAFLSDKIEDLDQNFYVCGPPGFVESVNGALEDLGADPESLVFEQ